MMNKRTLMIAGGVVIFLLVVFFVVKGKKAANEANAAAAPAQALYTKAQSLAKSNEVVQAKELYQQIVAEYPDYEGVENVQRELEDLNLRMITSNIQSPNAVTHQVMPGDSLVKIAKKYGTTVELIKKRNNLTGDVIRAGQKLSVWTGSLNVFVDKSQNILILKEGEQVVKVYNVSTGANNSTPVGTFKITTKLVDPVWFKSGAVIPPESPQNVLGSRWMGFDLQGYGIHGTVEPENIGKQVTAGCVRMRNAEVDELFDLLPMGTSVVVVD